MITMFRGAMVSQIYAKTLTLHAGVYDESAAVTLMSTDVDRMAVSLQQITEVWALLVQLAIAIWLLEDRVGWICVGPIIVVAGLCSPGVSVGFLLSWLIERVVSVYGAFRVGNKIAPAQKTWLGAVQKRVALTSSMLSSMKSVKMMGLSGLLSSSVQGQRVHELNLSAGFRVFGIWRNVICKTTPTLFREMKTS